MGCCRAAVGKHDGASMRCCLTSGKVFLYTQCKALDGCRAPGG